MDMQKNNSRELLDRQRPSDIEAEHALIGSLIINPDLIDDIVPVVKPDDFYGEESVLIYRVMVGAYERGKKIDVQLLATELKKAGVYDKIGGAATLARICQSVPSCHHATWYATRVRECAVRRQLIDASLECFRDAFDEKVEHEECLARHETRVMSIGDQAIETGPIDAMGMMKTAFSELEGRMNGAAPDGVKTGYSDLDQMLGGMRPGQLIILAARPGMGKSALALNIAESVAVNNGHAVLFISLEMTSIELADRLLASRANVSAHRIRSGTISHDDREKIVEQSASISQSPLEVYDAATQTVRLIGAVSRRMKRKTGLKLLIIDYLQLIESDNPSEHREQQVARITRRLKALAKDLGCPVLCLSQLNRQAEDSRDNKPRLRHLRESGAIEQDADVVLFVHRDEYFEPANDVVRGLADVIVAKQRNGPTGEVKMIYRKEIMRFDDRAPDRISTFDEWNDRKEVFA